MYGVKTKAIDVPHFVDWSYSSVVEFDPIVGRRDVVPSPVAVQPIVEILFRMLMKSFMIKVIFHYVATAHPHDTKVHPIVFHGRTWKEKYILTDILK